MFAKTRRPRIPPSLPDGMNQPPPSPQKTANLEWHRNNIRWQRDPHQFSNNWQSQNRGGAPRITPSSKSPTWKSQKRKEKPNNKQTHKNPITAWQMLLMSMGGVAIHSAFPTIAMQQKGEENILQFPACSYEPPLYIGFVLREMSTEAL